MKTSAKFITTLLIASIGLFLTPNVAKASDDKESEHESGNGSGSKGSDDKGTKMPINNGLVFLLVAGTAGGALVLSKKSQAVKA